MKTRFWADTPYAAALDKHDAIMDYIMSEGRVIKHRKDSSLSTTTETNDEMALDHRLLARSMDIVKGAIRLYGPLGVVASFNGGKDATVVLDMFVAALADFYRKHADLARLQPRAVYFLNESTEFTDVKRFVERQQQILDLQLTVCLGGFSGCITSFVESLCPKRLKESEMSCHPAFLLGVRRGDPRTEGLGVYEPSSDWLNSVFMRVHPILDWSYGTVWDYVEAFRMPYCKLYDAGYTSLGKIHETRPNPRLKAAGLRARDLQEWSKERWGRCINQTSTR